MVENEAQTIRRIFKSEEERSNGRGTRVNDMYHSGNLFPMGGMRMLASDGAQPLYGASQVLEATEAFGPARARLKAISNHGGGTCRCFRLRLVKEERLLIFQHMILWKHNLWLKS